MSTPVGSQSPVGSASGGGGGGGFRGSGSGSGVGPDVGRGDPVADGTCVVGAGVRGLATGSDDVVGSVVVSTIAGEGADGDCPTSDAVVSFASPAPDTSHQIRAVTTTMTASVAALRTQYTCGGSGPDGRITVLIHPR